jgi:hypothetical protein
MDPKACLQRLLQALLDGDRREVSEATDDLRGWIARGGCLPSPGQVKTLLLELACEPLPFVIGQRIRLVKGMEVFNLGSFPADALGTVTRIDPWAAAGQPIVYVQMEMHFGDLDGYDNELQVFRETDGEITLSVWKPA